MLAKEGLSLLAGVISGGGKKAVEMITEKTGIDVADIADPKTETEITPEQLEVLRKFEVEEVVSLAEIVSKADPSKAPGIIMAAIAPEVPELILFGMGVALVLGFLVGGQHDIAAQLGSAWIGAFAMYVKGK